MAVSISRQFARWAGALGFDDLPQRVVDKVKALVLFHLVADLFGATDPHARALLALLKSEARKPDGATILIDGTKVTREAASTANCELAHVAGLWDSFRMITHPGPVLVAAGIANAELERRSGAELITALAAGYEFECRLADDFVPSTSARGFRPAPIFSTMGAAMVVSKLLGLGEDDLATAIAIAASSASGLNEPGRVGADERNFHEPNAARQGVFAATMASLREGRGSESVIEGDAGFYATYAGSRDGSLSYVFQGPRRVDLASVTEGLGSVFKLCSVMFRIYNASGYNQPVIELVTELRRDPGFSPDEVAELRIAMNYLETLYPSPEFPRFADPTQARPGSIQYYAAHAAVHGSFPVVGGSAADARELERDAAVLSFMADKVRLVGVHDQPMFSPEIEVRLSSGETIVGRYPYEKMAWGFDELVSNLERCVPQMPGGKARLDSLVALAGRLDELSSMDPLIEEMAAAGGD